MADPGEILQQRVVALLDIVAGIPGGIAGATAAGDDDVVDLIESAQLVLQSAQGILAAAAGELARRSSGSGQQSLARRLGWKTARGVIAAKAGISFGEAARAVSVGEAIRPRVASSGENLPADRPHLAAAVLAGDLPLQVAQLIDRTVEQLATRLDPDLLAVVERDLVAKCCSGRYSVAAFTAHCHRVVEHFDPAGSKGRDDALRRKASVHETWLPNGMLRIVAELDPEAAAFYRTAVRARTNPKRAAGSTGGAVVTDLGARRASKQPTAMEARVAAFIGIMRDAVRIDDGKQAGVDTTILVPDRSAVPALRNRIRDDRRNRETDIRIRGSAIGGRSRHHPAGDGRQIAAARSGRIETRVHESAAIRDPRRIHRVRVPGLRHPVLDARVPPRRTMGLAARPRARHGPRERAPALRVPQPSHGGGVGHPVRRRPGAVVPPARDPRPGSPTSPRREPHPARGRVSGSVGLPRGSGCGCGAGCSTVDPCPPRP
ncbi:DUF222 domain-containing protein [uncultured Amnibacterium sp.]|uniref:DUF222 domain-containing protein n=1 Tax=uncultured Amnibacterium sp. TaxID=1631851 RepID=UPI0035CB6136